MTTTGKTLTIINLFLSFTFLGLAVYVKRSHVDLAAMVRAARSERQAAEQRKNEIQEVVTKLEESKTLEEGRLAEAEKQNKERAAGLNSKIEELAKELSETRQKLDNTGKEVQDTALQQQQQREQVDALRDQLGGLDGDNEQLQSQKSDLENQLAQATINLRELTSRNDEIIRRITSLEKLPSGQ